MSQILEEKLREAACIGDTDAVLGLLTQNIDINSKHATNGWTALHWACRRGHDAVIRILLNHGADRNIENTKGETPLNVAVSSPTINSILGESHSNMNNKSQEDSSSNFIPNYLKNVPLNGQVEIGRLRDMKKAMPTTNLPATQNSAECRPDSDILVVKIRICGSTDLDFIEVEIPRWKLTYNNLLKICAHELEVVATSVERIRKLPNTRLRNDSDVKRLVDFQEIEIVLKSGTTDKGSNCYQSISTCKDQTILY